MRRRRRRGIKVLLPQDFLNVTLVYEDCSGSQVRPTGPQQMC